MMKRVLLLVCLWLCLGLSGHAALNEVTTIDRSGPIPKNGDTALALSGSLISIKIKCTIADEFVNEVRVSISNPNKVASASVTIGSDSFDRTSFGVGEFDIMEGSNQVSIPSGNELPVIFDLKLKDNAAVGDEVVLTVVSIGSLSGLNKTATVTVSGFQGVTVNSAVSGTKILAGHANFPVLNVEVGPMVGEGLNSGLSVGVEKNLTDIINRVRLCLDVDKNNVIDDLGTCGGLATFSGNRATPNLNNGTILGSTTGAGSTTNVLVVYDLSTSTPNSSLSYKAKVINVLGTGNRSNQEISETETTFSGSGNNLNLELVGVLVDKTANSPTGNVIPGNVTNDMLIIAVDSVGVSVNVAKLNIGRGTGVAFQEGERNKVRSIHIFDGTSLSSADAFNSPAPASEATVTLNKVIQPNDINTITIQYVLPDVDDDQVVEAEVKDTSEFQVTVNNTAYIANAESGTENFTVFNVPILSGARSVSDTENKVVLRAVETRNTDSIVVGQESIPLFDLNIHNRKAETAAISLNLRAIRNNVHSGFDLNNSGIVSLKVSGDTKLNISNLSNTQTLQFSVKPGLSTYTVFANMGQADGAAGMYTVSLEPIVAGSGIDVHKTEDLNKTTSLIVTTHQLDVSFDSFLSSTATVTVTNNTGATVTLNIVALSAFENSLGGNEVALDESSSRNIVITNTNSTTISLPVVAVLNAEAMDVVFLPNIQAMVSGNVVRFSRYRGNNGNFTSPFAVKTRGVMQSFTANTDVDPSMVHIESMQVDKDGVVSEFENGDAVTPNSRFIIKMLNPSSWDSVRLDAVSAVHSESYDTYDASTGELITRPFQGSGSFSLLVTPSDTSSLPFSIPIRFLMSRSLVVSDPLFYPNPYNTAGRSPLQMAINTTTPSDVDITVYDMRGRPIVSHNQSVPLGYSNVTIPSTGQLASGMYLAYVVIKSGGDSVKKVVRLAVY